ncbi:MAG TPA: molybdopterin cofactor-binding domain-containing protein, partial [Acidimicrobiia bacterium]|nr:molybdopterin cofactor-binding domain-containing protein [Acidimicrobiia bacterium]
MPVSGSILGNPVQRVEDPRILHGEARYFDDLPVDGLAHVVFVRSTVAHARVTGVDTADAERMPGVLAVYTAANLAVPDVQGFIMLPPAFSRPALANGIVRFVGDIVAAVVAETRSQAVDAAEAVVVDYDPLPVVLDPEAALAEGAPVLFPDHGTNEAIAFNFGEDDTVLDGADVVVEGRFVNQRIAAVPMEPNGILVQPEGDGLLVHVPTQAPFGVRDQLAPLLGLEPEQVRVVAPAVGGGFGAKTGCYPEYVIVGAAARALGRPLKWSETRSENMVAMNQGRGQVQLIKLGVKNDGTIVGIKGKVFCDAGAYPSMGAFLPFLTRSMSAGVYKIDKIELNTWSAATNTTTTGAYRGAGRPEATQYLERILDMAAVELGMDPVEIRRKNFIPPESFPLTTVTGSNYDVGEYAKALDEACRVAGY